MCIKVFRILCMSFLGGALFSSQAQAEFGIHVPYQEAVISFQQAITEKTQQVLNSQQLQDIAQWHEENMNKIGSFLEQLKLKAQGLENETDPNAAFNSYQNFSTQWNVIRDSFPYWQDIAPHMEEIVQQATAGLPGISSQPSDSGASPTAPLFRYFQKSEQTNPWGLASVWQLEPLQEDTKEIHQSRVTERVEGGVQKYSTSFQRDQVQSDGGIVFAQEIENDQIQAQFIEDRGPTFLHDAIDEAVEDQQDPALLTHFQNALTSMNETLFTQQQEGVLDDCSYQYITREDRVEFMKVCTDAAGEQQKFSDILKHNPFDWFHSN